MVTHLSGHHRSGRGREQWRRCLHTCAWPSRGPKADQPQPHCPGPGLRPPSSLLGRCSPPTPLSASLPRSLQPAARVTPAPVSQLSLLLNPSDFHLPVPPALPSRASLPPPPPRPAREVPPRTVLQPPAFPSSGPAPPAPPSLRAGPSVACLPHCTGFREQALCLPIHLVSL